MSEYAREYFDRNAAAWVEQAYVEGDVPPKFPVGPERVRLALEGVAGAVPPGGALVDLGCGGGQLCFEAARLGWSAVGVDVAPGMIEEAESLRGDVPVRFVVAPYDASGLPPESFDAVTALGLIEYLPDDDGLFAEARRLLRDGGRFAVSCRNRLYNLASLNRYTGRELELGEANTLLGELLERLADTDATHLRDLADELAAAAPELSRAAELDGAGGGATLLDHPTAFGEERRQHTPSQLERSASRAGFRPTSLLALHPHPLPADLERLAPRVYNRLALAWQRPLEASPLGLALCSAFVAVFEC